MILFIFLGYMVFCFFIIGPFALVLALLFFVFPSWYRAYRYTYRPWKKKRKEHKAFLKRMQTLSKQNRAAAH